MHSKRKNNFLVGIALFMGAILTFFSACNCCTNNPPPDDNDDTSSVVDPPVVTDDPDTARVNCDSIEDKYYAVSNTHGEIQKIMIRTWGDNKPSFEYYLGLADVIIPPTKIVKIETILALHASAIQQLHSSNPESNPATLAGVLTKNMGDNRYDKLKKEFPFLTTMKSVSQGFTGHENIPDTTLRRFEKSVEKKVIEYTAVKLKQVYGKKFKAPEQMVVLDYAQYDMSRAPDPNQWAQDPFHALQKFISRDSVQLVYSDNLPEYQTWAEKMRVDFPDIKLVRKSYTDFAGGNFIPTKNYMLAGKTPLYSNYNVDQPNRNITVANYQNSILDPELKAIFNTKHIIWSGYDTPVKVPGKLAKKNQPIFHIDMFLTPAGTTDDGKNLIFFGFVDTNLYKKNIPDKLDRRRKEIIDSLNLLIGQTVNSIKQYYTDNHASDPCLKEFVFDTIPLIVVFGTSQADTHDQINNFKSLNNAIVEITQTKKRVLLSNFIDSSHVDITAFKQKAQAKYESYRFEVKFVRPPADALKNGALHCYTKVLWRDPY